MRAWIVRGGRTGERERQALEKGVAIVGWSDVGDLSQFADRASLRRHLRDVFPTESNALLGNWTGQLWRFGSAMRAGDIVVMPLKQMGRKVAIGRVRGAYRYETDTSLGFRHIRPVSWIKEIPRSDLAPDLLHSLGTLLTVAELSRHNAADRFAAIQDGRPDPGWFPEGVAHDSLNSREELFTRAAEDESTGVSVSIRQLLTFWNISRRTDAAVTKVERDLADAGLTTVPSLANGWLDNVITVVPTPPEPVDIMLMAVQETIAQRDIVDPVSLRIDTLQSSNSHVVGISEGADLRTAITLMLQHDFSQLPVLNDQGEITGVVSWESIGRARLGTMSPSLRDATGPSRTVVIDADLLGVVAEVASHDYVFVINTGSYRPIGIITVADLADQFFLMVKPFSLIEEIERRLRRRTDEKLPVAAMRAAVRGSGAKINSAADLTMGNYKSLFSNKDNFLLLEWDLDFSVFVELLSDVHQLRNDLMHFSTDPLTDEDLSTTDAFLRMLRVVDPRA